LLRSERGENFVDSAIRILIAVVIGALLLAGLYTLFGDTVLPTLKQRIQEMFNYGG
jgi:lipopolysaccharide export LptBFGC system permease protein LptF